MAVMQEKNDYLTKKLFSTSSERSKDIEGQLSLLNETEQEAASGDVLIACSSKTRSTVWNAERR